MRKNAVGGQFGGALAECFRPLHDLVHDILVHGPQAHQGEPAALEDEPDAEAVGGDLVDVDAGGGVVM